MNEVEYNFSGGSGVRLNSKIQPEGSSPPEMFLLDLGEQQSLDNLGGHLEWKEPLWEPPSCFSVLHLATGCLDGCLPASHICRPDSRLERLRLRPGSFTPPASAPRGSP